MEPIIKISNLYKDYKVKDGLLHALQEININIYEKDIYGIIGLSGAGKSTLIRCINLLEKPTKGSVIFNGKDLTKITKKELLKERQKIGMIFQNFNLLDQRNVFKNVAYPLELAGIKKDEAREKVLSLLDIVGLSDKVYAYPSQLSGGQKQRVAIARALANNPNVLLCDEPTSALDPNTTNQILDLLKKINKDLGVTIIIITHEMRIIDAICNKVSIIDNSSIVEEGNVSDIFKHPKSSIAKELILPSEAISLDKVGNNYIRIVYDGNVTKPILANLIIDCKCELSILSSNTKTIDGKEYGQIIIQIPDDKQEIILDYLKDKNIYAEEVAENDIRS